MVVTADYVGHVFGSGTLIIRSTNQFVIRMSPKGDCFEMDALVNENDVHDIIDSLVDAIGRRDRRSDSGHDDCRKEP